MSSNQHTWHSALDHLQRSGIPHVLATQVTSSGSTPREPGARMVITSDAVFDTLGGGTFEWQTINAAREHLIHQHDGFYVETFSLGGRSKQCCGGLVNILLDVFPGSLVKVAVFGAGHVGRNIVQLCASLPWQLHWYDSRSDAFTQYNQQQPRLICRKLDETAKVVTELPPHCHALVLTHNHDEDYALISALIERDDIGSIGLIGSESKWASFQGRLKRANVDIKKIQRVRSPIGCVYDTKLSNKTPYAIALTAVTELLWLSDQPSPQTTRGIQPEVLRTLFDNTTTLS